MGNSPSIGPTGSQGPQGQPGPKGIPGIQGMPGPQGPDGPQGSMGPIGNQGLEGIIGPIGSQGPIGMPGPQGIQGIQGITGIEGPIGTQGPTGNQGPQGPIGYVGNYGTLGPTGSPGTFLSVNGQSVIMGWTNDNCYKNNSTAFTQNTNITYTSGSDSMYSKCAKKAAEANSPIFALAPASTGVSCLYTAANATLIQSVSSALQNGNALPNASLISQGFKNACTNSCGDNSGNFCGSTGAYNVFQVVNSSPATYFPLNSAYVYPANPAQPPPSPYLYVSGNDGSVTGTKLCQGNWWNPDNINKNLVCLYGLDSSGNRLSCGQTGTPGGYYCAIPPYTGNNGSVTGHQYCQGAWGSGNGQNKNMVCVQGMDLNGNPLACNSTGTAGSWFCQKPQYIGNNGSVSGNTFCQGVWGNPNNTNKNMMCIGGLADANQNSLGCSSTGTAGAWLCY